jgi:hypothetical protein
MMTAMKKSLLCMASAALVAGALLAAPRADAAGGRSRIDFTPGGMSVTFVGGAKPAYYLPYTLTNPMDAAQRPRIYVELTTDTKRTYGDFADSRVVKAAEKAAKGGVKSTADLRAEDIAAGGTANGVANFGSIDPNADELTVKVYGLWDPIVRTRQGKVLKENRVLVLNFARRGDEYDRPSDPISLVSRKEEVVGDTVELYNTNTSAAEKK